MTGTEEIYMNKDFWKNCSAVLIGFLTVFMLSVGMDMLAESVGILPPSTQPEAYQWWHLVIALIYRSIFTIFGGFVTAHISATKPMRQVIILAVIGTILGGLGTIANWEMAKATGTWYPVVLFLASPVCIWWGGTLKKVNQGK
jgi:hypothetical protein